MRIFPHKKTVLMIYPLVASSFLLLLLRDGKLPMFLLVPILISIVGGLIWNVIYAVELTRKTIQKIKNTRR